LRQFHSGHNSCIEHERAPTRNDRMKQSLIKGLRGRDRG
jgi:hypothetical protein